MSAAEHMRGAAERYWTTEAYVRNVRAEVGRCARLGIDNIYWTPSIDLPADAPLPDKERLELIAQQLRREGLDARLVRSDGALRVSWQRKSWCSVM